MSMCGTSCGGCGCSCCWRRTRRFSEEGLPPGCACDEPADVLSCAPTAGACAGSWERLEDDWCEPRRSPDSPRCEPCRLAPAVLVCAARACGPLGRRRCCCSCCCCRSRAASLSRCCSSVSTRYSFLRAGRVSTSLSCLFASSAAGLLESCGAPPSTAPTVRAPNPLPAPLPFTLPLLSAVLYCVNPKPGRGCGPPSSMGVRIPFSEWRRALLSGLAMLVLRMDDDGGSSVSASASASVSVSGPVCLSVCVAVPSAEPRARAAEMELAPFSGLGSLLLPLLLSPPRRSTLKAGEVSVFLCGGTSSSCSCCSCAPSDAANRGPAFASSDAASWRAAADS